MKLIVLVTTILSVYGIRPQPEFTLRTPEQMARPLPTRGKPMPEHLNFPELKDSLQPGVHRPDPDPKPERPRPLGKDVMPVKPVPVAPHEEIPHPPNPLPHRTIVHEEKHFSPSQQRQPIRALHGQADQHFGACKILFRLIN